MYTGLLNRCADDTAPAGEVAEYVPASWRKQVNVIEEEIEPLENLHGAGDDDFELTIKSDFECGSGKFHWFHSCDDIISRLTLHRSIGLWTASGVPELYVPVQEEEKLSICLDKIARPEGNSPPLPGALLVDPFVRSLAQREGLKVAENAVWLVMVGMREYVKSLLKNTIVSSKAINEASELPDASALIRSIGPVAKERSTSLDGSKHTAPALSAGKRKCITTLDLASYLMASPVTCGRGNPRAAAEQCYINAFDPLLVTSQSGFESLQGYIASGIETTLPKKHKMERDVSFLPPGAKNIPMPKAARQSSPQPPIQQKPIPQMKPIQQIKATHQPKPIQHSKPTLQSKPVQQSKPIQQQKPIQQSRIIQQQKPPQKVVSLPSGPKTDTIPAKPNITVKPSVNNLRNPNNLRHMANVKGMGRGAKNLAALKARAAAAASAAKNEETKSLVSNTGTQSSSEVRNTSTQLPVQSVTQIQAKPTANPEPPVNKAEPKRVEEVLPLPKLQEPKSQAEQKQQPASAESGVVVVQVEVPSEKETAAPATTTPVIPMHVVPVPDRKPTSVEENAVALTPTLALKAGDAPAATPSIPVHAPMPVETPTPTLTPASAPTPTLMPASAPTPAPAPTLAHAPTPAPAPAAAARRGGRGFGAKNLAMMRARMSTVTEDPKPEVAQPVAEAGGNPTGSKVEEIAAVTNETKNDSSSNEVSDANSTSQDNSSSIELPAQIINGDNSTTTDGDGIKQDDKKSGEFVATTDLKIPNQTASQEEKPSATVPTEEDK